MRKKKFLLGLSLLALFTIPILFTSCSSDDEKEIIIDDQPGEIPGLGNAEGEITGAEFILPNGIELEGDIVGISYKHTKSTLKNEAPESFDFSNATKSATEVIGSGYYVQVTVKLTNTTNRDIDVIFPARLVVKSLSGRYQNGVLLKRTKAIAPANATHTVALLMYCGNSSMSPSSTSEKYKWAAISNSSLIVDLCNRLVNKKINYEEFSGSESGYRNQVDNLQHILWNLTDGTGLRESDIEYIDSLPNS
ncbi:MAG: hypothetical protein ACK5M3_17545 [Dysgonomonas sp.]